MESYCSETACEGQEGDHFRRIGFLVYPDCQSLDLSGPFETFHWANLMLSVLRKPPTYHSVVIAQSPGPVQTMSGLQIVASHSYREVVDGLDTLAVVGGSGCEAAIKDSKLIDWVRSIAPSTRRIVSICTGAVVLAEAGLLDRRRATTHWVYADQLAKAYPSVEVELEPHLCPRRKCLHISGDYSRYRPRTSSGGGGSGQGSDAGRSTRAARISEATGRSIAVQGPYKCMGEAFTSRHQ